SRVRRGRCGRDDDRGRASVPACEGVAEPAAPRTARAAARARADRARCRDGDDAAVGARRGRALRRRRDAVGAVDVGVAHDEPRAAGARDRPPGAGGAVTTQALRAKALDVIALVKPRIMVMALLTAAGAMTLAPHTVSLAHALLLLAGTALIVGSANTLNMW